MLFMRKIFGLIIPFFMSIFTLLVLASPAHSDRSESAVILTERNGYYPLGLNDLSLKTRGAMVVPLSLWSVDALIPHLQTESFILGFYYGFMLIMIGYHFFIGLTLRDKSYKYYVFFLLMNLILSSSKNGIFEEYFLLKNPDINPGIFSLTMGLSLLAFIRFSETFLNRQSLTPNFHQYFRFLSIAIAGFTILILWPVSRLFIWIFIALLLLTYWLIFIAIILSWRQGQKQARYFFFAQLLLLIQANLTLFSIGDLLPAQFQILVRYPGLGILPVALFIAFALGDRINILRQNQEKEQAETLRVKEELNQALHLAKADLEKRVKERTEDLQKAKITAEVANRTKSQLIANVSHELRTPLNGILGYAQILRRDDRLTEKQKEGLDVIYNCSSHLSSIIDEILDISKFDVENIEIYPADFCLPEFLAEIVEPFQERSRQKQLNFLGIFDEGLPLYVRADPDRLRQILNHLLDNAVEFTPRGSITFEVQLLEILPLPQSPVGTAKIHFSIEDTGRGLTSQQIEKLFQPFEQVGDRIHNAEGTGLGLAISQRLVQIMGGQIHVESYPDRGSQFWFDLELTISTEEVPSKPTIKAENIIGFSGDRRKILVVDDRPENRSFLKHLLESLGFTVAEAENGQQGIEQVHIFQPDLVITDLIMPVKDGLKMIRQLRQSPQFNNLPIVVASGSASGSIKQLALESGCNDLITKPIRVNELLQKLQVYLPLQWIYAGREMDEEQVEPDPSETSLIVPPIEELSDLIQAARIGDIDTLEREAKRLKQVNPSYTNFANKVLQFARDFDDRAILKLIEA